MSGALSPGVAAAGWVVRRWVSSEESDRQRVREGGGEVGEGEFEGENR